MTDHSPDPSLLSIGAFARASGLSVSALRFYDSQGLLSPAAVDPATGYRRYAPSQVRAGRLAAAMRRVQLPLAEMAVVLTSAEEDHLTATDLLDAHQHRLEDNLRRARRELDRLRQMLSPASRTLTIDLPVTELLSALGSVRYAVGADPGLPVLSATLLERTSETVVVVATDRFRLAAASLPDQPGGPPVRIVLPAAVVDALLDCSDLADFPAGTSLRITAPDASAPSADRPGLVEVRRGSELLASAPALLDDYPDVAQVLDLGSTGYDLPVNEVRRDVWELPEGIDDVVITRSGVIGGPSEIGDPDLGSVGEGLLFSRDLLWDALAAFERGVLTLPLDGTIGPAALTDEVSGLRAMVMPKRAREPHPAESRGARGAAAR